MTTTVTNLVKSVTTLLALNTLANASTRTIRKVGDTLRYKTSLAGISATTTPAEYEAVGTLADAGHRVRLFEGDSIVTVTRGGDGQRVFETRMARTHRTHAVVEVSL